MEGVVILHETIHELHTKKLNGVIFKVDYEKAYDKVKWHFIQQTLRMKVKKAYVFLRITERRPRKA